MLQVQFPITFRPKDLASAVWDRITCKFLWYSKIDVVSGNNRLPVRTNSGLLTKKYAAVVSNSVSSALTVRSLE